MERPANNTRLLASIRAGLLVLVAVMPFHAFLSVWGGHLFGHQGIIQAWKDILALALVASTGWYVVRNRYAAAALRQPVAYLILAFAVVAGLVTVFTWPGLSAVAYGVKTDIEFLALFMVAYVVGSTALTARLVRVIVMTGIVVAVIAALLSFALPPDFLARFGYGPDTILPFRLIGPAAYGIRTPATLGGPNQLGAYLIIPFCLGVAVITMRRWLAPIIAILTLGIYVSFSRSAWIGAAIGAWIAALAALSRRVALGITALSVLVAFMATLALFNWSGSQARYYLFHARPGAAVSDDSTAQHLAAVQDAGVRLAAHPFGMGLGSAGPASFQTTRPVISEDYYLQIALETGVLGLVLFAGIIGAVGWKLYQARTHSVARGLLGALIGLSVANLFLHVWADSTTALVFWIAEGTFLGSVRIPLKERRHAA